MGFSLRKGNSYSETQVGDSVRSEQEGRSALGSSKLASPEFRAALGTGPQLGALKS